MSRYWEQHAPRILHEEAIAEGYRDWQEYARTAQERRELEQWIDSINYQSRRERGLTSTPPTTDGHEPGDKQ